MMILVLEGIDGVGKGTQSRLLAERLAQAGRPCTLLSFPQYASFFGRLVAAYLNGEFGSLKEVPPRLAALLYALDRWVTMRGRDPRDLYVMDRYVPSNLAHQAAKLDGAARAEMIRWIEELEYEVLGLPRPDLVLVLDSDPALAAAQVLKKGRREYTRRAQDLHERESEYLTRVREVFLQLCAERTGYVPVRCDRAGAMRPIPEIAEEIWSIVFHERRTRP